MKALPSSFYSLLTSIPCLALAWVGCSSNSQALEDKIQESFTVQPGGLLNIDVDRGSLHLHTRPDIQEIQVVVTRKVRDRWFFDEQKALDSHSIQFNPHEKGLQITSGFQKQSTLKPGKLSNLQVTYEITLPEIFECQLKTKGGSVEINRLIGNFEAETSGGSMRVGEIQGTVKATTVGGRIELEKGHDKIDLVTAGGSIQVDEAIGYLNARTSAGGIRVSKANGGMYVLTAGGSIDLSELEGLGSVRAVTSGGRVSARFSSSPKHPVALATSGGSIDLRLPVASSVLVDAETSGGTVYCDFVPTKAIKQQKNALKAELNGGGPEIKIRTSGGSIRIHP